MPWLKVTPDFVTPGHKRLGFSESIGHNRGMVKRPKRPVVGQLDGGGRLLRRVSQTFRALALSLRARAAFAPASFIRALWGWHTLRFLPMSTKQSDRFDGIETSVIHPTVGLA
ncbi:MAG: hypothetical protein WBE85_16720 [Methylocella sp.]